jgi:hypothetical protein
MAMDTILPPPGQSTFAVGPDYFGKFQIRLLRRYKDVYKGVGLPAVWDMINNLNKLVGAAPQAGPRINDWSVKRDLAPFANRSWPLHGSERIGQSASHTKLPVEHAAHRCNPGANYWVSLGSRCLTRKADRVSWSCPLFLTVLIWLQALPGCFSAIQTEIGGPRHGASRR